MEAKRKKTERAVVVGKSGNKSIRVRIDFLVKHPMYGKYLRRKTVLGVHDEANQAGVGDTVEIVECRPMSKSKSWRLLKVIEKAVNE
jgi:small subunit ribosomal protein S17